MSDDNFAEGQRLVHVGVGAMVVACAIALAIGYRVGGPVINEVGYPLKPRAEKQDDGSMLVTLNTSDTVRWVPFSFELGQEVPDGAAADILIRRHYWQSPAGSALAAEKTPLMKVEVDESIEWVDDGLSDGFSVSPVMLRWYSYSYWTHLLESKHDIYAVRIRGDADRAALLRLESYYCAPEGSGCMTFRYRLVDMPEQK